MCLLIMFIRLKATQPQISRKNGLRKICQKRRSDQRPVTASDSLTVTVTQSVSGSQTRLRVRLSSPDSYHQHHEHVTLKFDITTSNYQTIITLCFVNCSSRMSYNTTGPT